MICLKKIKIQVYFICIKAYCIVVWEPSVAQGVIVSPTDYPRFVLNMILTIFPDESRSTQLRISKLKKCLFLNTFLYYITFPWVSEFPNQNLGQIGPGVLELWSDIQTNRQTEITSSICIKGERFFTNLKGINYK